MPKQKSSKRQAESDSDSGPEDRGPAKKQNVETKEKSWDLGNNRFAKLTEFKAKWYIDIREFYSDDDGNLKPGKKGIMLTIPQWQKFKGCLDEIDEAVNKYV